MVAELLKIDVGAGAKKEPGFVTVDVTPYFQPDFLASVTELPFADGSADEVRCWHVLEHLPRNIFVFHWEPKEDIRPVDRGVRMSNGPSHEADLAALKVVRAGSRSYIETRLGLVDAMNEMWRVLAVGGHLDIEIPVFPHWPAIADPTHVSFYVPQTFEYFRRCDRTHEHGGEGCFELHRRMYGIRPWADGGHARVMDGQVARIGLIKLDDEVFA